MKVLVVIREVHPDDGNNEVVGVFADDLESVQRRIAESEEPALEQMRLHYPKYRLPRDVEWRSSTLPSGEAVYFRSSRVDASVGYSIERHEVTS